MFSTDSFCVHWQKVTPFVAEQLMLFLHTSAFRMSPQLAPELQLHVPFKQENVDFAAAGDTAEAQTKTAKARRRNRGFMVAPDAEQRGYS